MKKIILAALVVASLFASCSSEKTFKKKDGSTITAKPYGWASKENKVEGVNYELNAPDVVVSIIFAPSVIAPALLTAYDVWEPVSYMSHLSLSCNRERVKRREYGRDYLFWNKWVFWSLSYWH